jgi:MurNAc alpha-1-phosphate uridylyltransferase
MILAAGLGERMRPLTLDRPKPLLMLGSKTILDHVLAHFTAAQIPNLVVNAHYKGEMIRDHLRGMPGVAISAEETLLETGGGIKQALPLLGAEAFFTANADTVWRDGAQPALQRLAARWDDTAMDALLLLTPATGRAGDYAIDENGRLTYRPDGKTAPYLYAGLCLLHPRLFAGAPEGRFSLKLLWDRAEAAGRLTGVAHDGAWYHLGTPGELDAAQKDFA